MTRNVQFLRLLQINPKLTRALRGIALGLAILLGLLYLGLPAGMGIAAVFPTRAKVGDPPVGFAEVTLQASDGVELHAWYAPPANGAVILLLHGAGGSRDSVRGYAQMLARRGFGVLALDLRGHGRSQGQTNRLGWQGTLDVEAAVQFLLERPEVRSIGGLGISMGGEVLLGAASACPALLAIAADGATRRSTQELLALETERPLVRSFTARVMYATVRLLSYQPPPKPLYQSMLDSRQTQYLLIAAGSSDLEVAFNRLFAGGLGARADLWIAPQVSHTAAFSAYPREYEQRVIAFFTRTLLP